MQNSQHKTLFVSLKSQVFLKATAVSVDNKQI